LIGRFEETNNQSIDCKPGEECIGGYARVVTTIKELMKSEENPIYLNAGDNYQGTLWYNIGRWNVTNEFLNMLPADAQTIGNHEFDHGIDGIVPFLKNTKTPVVIANVDDSNEPSFQGTYNKSIVIEKYGKKIGVIGAILRSTDTIARTENVRFFDETTKIREEAARLKANGVKIIIALTHCGINRDHEIASNVGEDIDIIVGGHSHTFLWNGTDFPSGNPAGVYPQVVTQSSGHRVLIVQASAYTKYVGKITLYFDDDGKVQDWSGQPIFMASNITKDPEVVQAMIPWKEKIDREGERIVGSTKFRISNSGCYSGDCLMGNLQAESMVFSAFEETVDDNGWTTAAIAITNAGGVRASLPAGSLSYSNLVATTPFENTADKMEIQGKYIREALEFSARNPSSLSILQTSGIKVVFNITKPRNERIESLKVLCRLCDVPRYDDIEDETWYRVVLNNFLLNNGDNFSMFRENGRNHKTGPVDIDALTNYVEKNSPITMLPPRGRVEIIT
jgi:5'-nucleotidase